MVQNIADLNNIILQRLHVIPRDFDLIVGVPRSGMLASQLTGIVFKQALYRYSFFHQRAYLQGRRRGSFFDVKQYKKYWWWMTAWLPAPHWMR